MLNLLRDYNSSAFDTSKLYVLSVFKICLEHFVFRWFDGSKGHYQFKHLSFQEYLAAAETAHDFQPVASSNGERPFARSWLPFAPCPLSFALCP